MSSFVPVFFFSPPGSKAAVIVLEIETKIKAENQIFSSCSTLSLELYILLKVLYRIKVCVRRKGYYFVEALLVGMIVECRRNSISIIRQAL